MHQSLETGRSESGGYIYVPGLSWLRERDGAHKYILFTGNIGETCSGPHCRQAKYLPARPPRSRHTEDRGARLLDVFIAAQV